MGELYLSDVVTHTNTRKCNHKRQESRVTEHTYYPHLGTPQSPSSKTLFAKDKSESNRKVKLPSPPSLE